MCPGGGATDWKDHLPWVLLGMRAAPREESGVSAAEAALQHQLLVPGQLPPPSEQPVGIEGPPASPLVILPTGRSYAQAVTSSSLDGVDWIYMARGGASKPMAYKYSSPYKVLERDSKAWKLQVGERVDLISRNRLKPHLGSVAPKAAKPPKPGRPRTASEASGASASVAAKQGGPV